MAGGTLSHAAIAVNIAAMLRDQLRGKPCRVFSSDLRIRVQATGLGTYPDVSVMVIEAGGTAALRSVAAELPLEEIYDDPLS